jgi:uncharacterized protein YprB with RNaseH-like and TPR domain
MENDDLRDQLRRLDLGRLGLSRGARDLKPRTRRKEHAIETLLAGEVQHTGHGPFFLYRERYELGYRHGHHALTDLLGHAPELPAHLAGDERLARVAFRRMAFVDTETTGLAGGTGTYAFLVGVGVFEENGFSIYQFFMRDYHEEPAQLQALGELLDGLDAVVSFNGKSFDLPLLETRFIMSRQPPRLIGAPHLDLLSSARRLWKYRLESCSLGSLEREVLGVERTQSDVPGWLIPSLYMEYARTGDAREMPRIFYHNAQDILSLVTLAARQCDLLSMPLPPDGAVAGEDLYGLGRFLHELGQPDRAEIAYTHAARVSEVAGVRERAMRELAYLLKRQERRAEALPWWQALAQDEGGVYACEELAKHFEWHDVDLLRALTWTRRGITLAQGWPAGFSRDDTLAALQHRLERLERKVELS